MEITVYIATSIKSEPKFPVYYVYAPARLRIHQFMMENGISDVMIRSLSIPELKDIQGFGRDFEMLGTKTQQLNFIGNSVEPNIATALVNANMEGVEHLSLAA